MAVKGGREFFAISQSDADAITHRIPCLERFRCLSFLSLSLFLDMLCLPGITPNDTVEAPPYIPL